MSYLKKSVYKIKYCNEGDEGLERGKLGMAQSEYVLVK